MGLESIFWGKSYHKNCLKLKIKKEGGPCFLIFDFWLI